MIIKLVITDIDGVWTDGGMYYDEKGNELKKFNTSDSAGVLFLRKVNIPLAIMTAEETAIVARRATKLGVQMVFQGVADKLRQAESLCDVMGIKLSEVAFIGDDISDIRLLKAVGFSAVPPTAPEYVAQHAAIKLSTPGGDGAFREFIERLLNKLGLLNEALNDYQ